MEAAIKTPKVSICIATHNQERYINECLMSALQQGIDEEFEILVGDDASTDGTNEIVRKIEEKYPGRIQLFTHQENLGASKNYQFLIERARGTYIAHLDGDDFWLPGKLAFQLDFLEGHPECVAVYSNAAVIDNRNLLVGVFTTQHPEVQDIHYVLHRGNFLPHSSMLYRSELKTEILSIDENFIDYRMHCRLALKGRLGYLNSPLIVYRSGAVGSIQTSHGERVRKWYWEVLREMNRLTERPNGLCEGIGKFLLQVFITGLRSGELRYFTEWYKVVRIETAATYSTWQILASFSKATFRKLFKLGQNAMLRIIQRDALVVVCVS